MNRSTSTRNTSRHLVRGRAEACTRDHVVYPRAAMQQTPVRGSMRRAGRRRALSACCALLWAIGTWACGNESPGIVLRLAHGLDIQHPVHRALVGMADDLEARSHGTLKVVIYPAEQLGNEREALELLQLGSLDLTKVSAAVLEGFAPAFVVAGCRRCPETTLPTVINSHNGLSRSA